MVLTLKKSYRRVWAGGPEEQIADFLRWTNLLREGPPNMISRMNDSFFRAFFDATMRQCTLRASPGDPSSEYHFHLL